MAKQLKESIVIQLQHLASDRNSDIEELLRKAFLVSSKLNLDDFTNWCQSELEGYKSIEEVPNYRVIKGILKFRNPTVGMIPVSGGDDYFIDEISTSVYGQPLSHISNLLSANNGGVLMKQLPPEIQKIFEKMQLNEHRRQFGGLYISSFDEFFTPFIGYVIFGKEQFLNIFSEIRNKILTWSLKLEKEGILGEGLNFTVKEKDAAMSVNNFHIQNMQGVAGNVSGGTINQNNQMNIQPKDFDSLAKHLMQNKVEFSDIQALQEAIESDPTPTEPNKLGSNVSSWIGNMIGKAANGSWDVSIAVAGTLLAEAITKFYGLG